MRVVVTPNKDQLQLSISLWVKYDFANRDGNTVHTQQHTGRRDETDLG